MSTKSATSLSFKVSPSRFLAKASVALHALAFAACGYNSLPVYLRTSAAAAVAISLFYSVNRHRETEKTVELRHSPASGWSLTIDAKTMPIDVLPSTYCHPYLIVLHYREDNKRFRAMPVFYDSVDDEVFRRLTVMLRITSGT